MSERKGVLTTSRTCERCDVCGNPIPAGATLALTWRIGPEDKQYAHVDCAPAAVRLLTLPPPPLGMEA